MHSVILLPHVLCSEINPGILPGSVCLYRIQTYCCVSCPHIRGEAFLQYIHVFHHTAMCIPFRITSEVGLEIDSQQEEESSQAPDESDLPSTSQDPPSSSSAGTVHSHSVLMTCIASLRHYSFALIKGCQISIIRY